MAGHPVLRAFEEEVDRRGGDDAVLDLVADAVPIKDIMASYGLRSRRCFYDWVNQTPERRKAFEVARKLSAEALVETGMSMTDTALDGYVTTEPKDSISQAREGAHFRRKIAEVTDRERYGPARSVKTGDVNVLNLGQLHLDALLAGQRTDALPAPKHEEIRDAEFEIVDTRVKDAAPVQVKPAADVDDLWEGV